MTQVNLTTGLVVFQAFTRGLLADKVINRQEAQALKDHMAKVPALQQVPILRDVWTAIEAALVDGAISDHGSDALVALLGDVADAAPEVLIESTRRAPVEGPVGAFLERLVVGDEYQIVYTGSDGKPGERNVMYKQLREKDGAMYIACFCLKAQAARTFLAARVSRAVHVKSGEIVL